ncbi:MAG: tetratricopeptide repeat protein [Bacteroidota bacterium]
MSENIHFQSGLEKCKSGQLEEAIQLFNQSLAQFPQHLPSYFNRAQARYQMGDFKSALKDFDEAINLAPNQAELYAERAITKHKLKDHRGAIKDLNKALQLEPNNPYRYSSRAYIRAFVGDDYGAVEDYQKAIELDPEDAISLNNLGLLEEKMGYKEAAQKRFQKADALADAGKNFEKPDLKEILENYEAKQKKNEETVRLVKEAMEKEKAEKKNPGIKEYWQVIRQVFQSGKDFGEFRDFVQNLFQIGKLGGSLANTL